MRDIGTAALAALSSDSLGMVTLVEMELSSPLRLCTSGYDITHDGDVYTGSGNLGSVSEITDTQGEVKGLSFSMSGIPSGYIAIALAEDVRGKPCRVFTGIVSSDTGALLDVVQSWSGTLDRMGIIKSADGVCTISVTAEHGGVTFGRPKPLRYTDADQQRITAGDTSMRFCVSQAQHQDIWPSVEWFKKS